MKRPDDWLDLVMDVATLHGIDGRRAERALTAALEGDYKPLRRLGHNLSPFSTPEAAIAKVRAISDGQAAAWLTTFDAQRKSVHA